MKFAWTSVGLVATAVGFSFVGACGGSTTDDGSSGTGAAGGISVAGAGGTIVITGAGGSSGTAAGGGSSVSLDAACVANVQEGESIPVNLHFLVDRSGSMTCPLGAAGQNCNNQANMRMPPDRWSAITDALNAFVAAPGSAGIGVGLQFFPANGNNNNADCNRATYQIPAVPFALLPGAANNFGIALSQTMPNGNTPTTPALQGAIDFARGQVMANPGRDVAVVLTSDGIPNGCNSTVANAAAAAQAGVMGTPSIKTYVIGVGPQLNNLNMIAAAGGTGQAFLIDTNNTPANVATQFTAALGKIAAPITCNYTIPTTGGKALDLNAVNVQARVGPSGSSQIIGKVNDAASCGTGQGWFYDNNVTPTKITLCPTTCTPLTNTMGSTLQILIGCATISGGVK